MIKRNDIAETLKMIEHDHLDIRTVTIGVSLLDCASSDAKIFADKIYDKITRTAERLVPVCAEIEKTYGIPIINKRVSITPIAIAGASLGKSEDFVRQGGAYRGHKLYRRIQRTCSEGNDRRRQTLSAFDSAGACRNGNSLLIG